MLTSRVSNVLLPEVEQAINEMVSEDARYMKMEMRSIHRDQLVVPVRILFKTGEMFSAFSRNVSPIGICLIGKDPISDQAIADLEIYRLRERPMKVMAGVRWCKRFGAEYYMSGWKFLQLRR